jgi:hypothetical protein
MSKPLAMKYLLLKECWNLRGSICPKDREEFCNSLAVHFLINKIEITYILKGEKKNISIEKNVFNFYAINKNSKNENEDVYYINKLNAKALIEKIFFINEKEIKINKKNLSNLLNITFLTTILFSQINQSTFVLLIIYFTGLLLSIYSKNKIFNSIVVISMSLINGGDYAPWFILLSIVDINTPLYFQRLKKYYSILLIIILIFSIILYGFNTQILLLTFAFLPFILLKKNLQNIFNSLVPVLLLYISILNPYNIILIFWYIIFQYILRSYDKNYYRNTNF